METFGQPVLCWAAWRATWGIAYMGRFCPKKEGEKFGEHHLVFFHCFFLNRCQKPNFKVGLFFHMFGFFGHAFFSICLASLAIRWRVAWGNAAGAVLHAGFEKKTNKENISGNMFSIFDMGCNLEKKHRKKHRPIITRRQT